MINKQVSRGGETYFIMVGFDQIANASHDRYNPFPIDERRPRKFPLPRWE